METIDLDIDEVNELAFKLRIDGVASGAVTARLYCESSGGLMHVVTGQFKGEPETVTFKVPQMSSLVTEGTYPSWIEVLIDNKQFVPATFNIKFKKPVSVQVENVITEASKPEVKPIVALEGVVVGKKPLEKKANPTKQGPPAGASDASSISLKDWYDKKRTLKK